MRSSSSSAGVLGKLRLTLSAVDTGLMGVVTEGLRELRVDVVERPERERAGAGRGEERGEGLGFVTAARTEDVCLLPGVWIGEVAKARPPG